MYNLIFLLMELGRYIGVDYPDYAFSIMLYLNRDCLIVQFLISREVLAMLPDEKLKLGKKINVVPILFTQGINEKQTLDDLKHT